MRKLYADCSLHGDVYSTYLRYVRLKPLQLSKGPPFSSLLEVTMQYKRCCPWILTCTPQFLEITPVSIMQDAAHSGRDNLSARILSISFRCSSSLKRLKIKRLLFITSETLVTLKDKWGRDAYVLDETCGVHFHSLFITLCWLMAISCATRNTIVMMSPKSAHREGPSACH